MGELTNHGLMRATLWTNKNALGVTSIFISSRVPGTYHVLPKSKLAALKSGIWPFLIHDKSQSTTAQVSLKRTLAPHEHPQRIWKKLESAAKPMRSTTTWAEFLTFFITAWNGYSMLFHTVWMDSYGPMASGLKSDEQMMNRI